MTAPSSPEPPSAEERLRELEAQVVALAEERDRLARERDEFKRQAAWFQAQLERLRDEAKTPRERVALVGRPPVAHQVALERLAQQGARGGVAALVVLDEERAVTAA